MHHVAGGSFCLTHDLVKILPGLFVHLFLVGLEDMSALLFGHIWISVQNRFLNEFINTWGHQRHKRNRAVVTARLCKPSLHICLGFYYVDRATVRDPHPVSFSDDRNVVCRYVVETVQRRESYAGYFSYHSIRLLLPLRLPHMGYILLQIQGYKPAGRSCGQWYSSSRQPLS